MNYLVRVAFVAMAIGFVSGYAWSQGRPRTVAKPPAEDLLIAIIPDPDKFDWSAEGGKRTGYDFRGMLPRHHVFYDYVKQKRKNDLPLTWAEQALVRHLILIRRWPDPPSPNPFWSACMIYLRGQRGSDLSVAEMILLDQMFARGFAIRELPDDPNFSRVREYLNSPAFEIENWFERTSPQRDPSTENLNAGWGYDMPYDAPYDPRIADVMKAEVRDTLGRLNDRNSSWGQEVESMQRALAAGDASWKEYVARHTKEMAASKSAEFSQYQELEMALRAGGDRWRQYVAANSTEEAEETPADAFATEKEEPPKDEAATKAAELINKAQAYSEKNDYAHAVLAYTQALDADPKSAESYAGRALAKAGLNDIEGATRDISRAINLDRNCASAYRARSLIKRALADPNGALTDASRAIELEATNPQNYLTRGLAYESLKDYHAAIVDYSVAVRLNPEYERSYLYRGLARLKLNQDEEAIADFDKVISINANDGVAYLNRGAAKENLGNLSGALGDYQEALRLNPEDLLARQCVDRLKPRK